MKKETLKNLKRNAREKVGPIPPQKVEKSVREYKRKPKNKKNSDEEE